MRNEREAGRTYYETSYARGWVECHLCVEQKYDTGWEQDTPPSLIEGEAVYEGLTRMGFPDDSCLVCESCQHPACWSIVCGACGFARGCVEHDEGHHTDCPERGN